MKLKWYCVFLFFISQVLSAQVVIEVVAASRTVNGVTYYYNSLYDAIAAVPSDAAGGQSSYVPDEINLLGDITVNAPLIIEENQHIAIVPEGGSWTIMRGTGFLEYPVIWIRGENSSLVLGVPGMEHALTIDGGYLNTPSIEAHAPLVAINGLDSRLVMHDHVFLQNNCNSGSGLAPGSYYNNGGGIYLRTNQDNASRSAQFIMKGGTIQGNINNVQHTVSFGGGVAVNCGIFIMEGGRIMGNSAHIQGGGVYIVNRAIFEKTGGIIYGINAEKDLRNIAVDYQDIKPHGHAILIGSPAFRFRNDTIYENENLTFNNTNAGENIFGRGEKWHDQYTLMRRNLLIAGIVVLILGSLAFWKRAFVFSLVKKAQPEISPEKANTKPKEKSPALIEAEGLLTDREKEIFYLLLSGKTAREISLDLNLSLSSINTHSEKIYRKLDIHSRTELMVKYK